MSEQAGESCFDHAAHSPLRPEARDAWLAASELTGNPSALHGAGRRARAALEDARESIAADLGAHPSEVVLTSGGSEADTIALLGSAAARPERPRVVVGAVEHPAVLGAVDRLGAETLAVDTAARVLPDSVAWGDDIAVVSVQTVNNEFGTHQPVDAVAERAHRVGAWCHSDAVQAVVWPGLDFQASPVDLLSISAHKIGGPVGIGALVARRDRRPHPVGLGGGQEAQLRSGTVPVALAAGFAAALRATVAERAVLVERFQRWRRQVMAVCERLDGARVNGGADCSPAMVNVTFPGLLADDLLLLLDQQGIHASVGSACRAGVHQPSEVVLASGGSEADARATLRFSWGWSTNDAEIERLVDALPDAVARARKAGGLPDANLFTSCALGGGK